MQSDVAKSNRPFSCMREKDVPIYVCTQNSHFKVPTTFRRTEAAAGKAACLYSGWPECARVHLYKLNLLPNWKWKLMALRFNANTVVSRCFCLLNCKTDLNTKGVIGQFCAAWRQVVKTFSGTGSGIKTGAISQKQSPVGLNSFRNQSDVC